MAARPSKPEPLRHPNNPDLIIKEGHAYFFKVNVDGDENQVAERAAVGIVERIHKSRTTMTVWWYVYPDAMPRDKRDALPKYIGRNEIIESETFNHVPVVSIEDAAGVVFTTEVYLRKDRRTLLHRFTYDYHGRLRLGQQCKRYDPEPTAHPDMSYLCRGCGKVAYNAMPLGAREEDHNSTCPSCDASKKKLPLPDKLVFDVPEEASASDAVDGAMPAVRPAGAKSAAADSATALGALSAHVPPKDGGDAAVGVRATGSVRDTSAGAGLGEGTGGARDVDTEVGGGASDDVEEGAGDGALSDCEVELSQPSLCGADPSDAHVHSPVEPREQPRTPRKGKRPRTASDSEDDEGGAGLGLLSPMPRAIDPTTSWGNQVSHLLARFALPKPTGKRARVDPATDGDGGANDDMPDCAACGMRRLPAVCEALTSWCKAGSGICAECAAALACVHCGRTRCLACAEGSLCQNCASVGPPRLFVRNFPAEASLVTEIPVGLLTDVVLAAAKDGGWERCHRLEREKASMCVFRVNSMRDADVASALRSLGSASSFESAWALLENGGQPLVVANPPLAQRLRLQLDAAKSVRDSVSEAWRRMQSEDARRESDARKCRTCGAEMTGVRNREFACVECKRHSGMCVPCAAAIGCVRCQRPMCIACGKKALCGACELLTPVPDAQGAGVRSEVAGVLAKKRVLADYEHTLSVTEDG